MYLKQMGLGNFVLSRSCSYPGEIHNTLPVLAAPRDLYLLDLTLSASEISLFYAYFILDDMVRYLGYSISYFFLFNVGIWYHSKYCIPIPIYYKCEIMYRKPRF